MADIATRFDGDVLAGDFAVSDGALTVDSGLTTAIVTSLFTDARGRPEDLPPGESEPRGWWGDTLADIQGDRWGSRLWTLRREKQTQETRLRAREMAQEALAWLIEDEIAGAVEVEAEWLRRGILGLRITVVLTTGAAETYTFDVSAGGG